MRYVGYHRVSTIGQNPERGINAIMDYCNAHNIRLHQDKVYVDRITGKNFDRPEYNKVKEVLDKGDALIISEVDRLGRNMDGILKEMRWFKDHEIRLMILEMPTTLMDLGDRDDLTAKFIRELINNVIIDVYAYQAQAETEKRAQRQREGIDAMKRSGRWEEYGRPRSVAFHEFASKYKSGMSRLEIMQTLNISSSTYTRLRSAYVIKYGERLKDNRKEALCQKRKDQYEAFVKLHRQGMSYAEVIKTLGIYPNLYYTFRDQYLTEQENSEYMEEPLDE